MDVESTSSTPEFKPDDLIWAKMKGFPPWPAKVILSSGDDIPQGRVPVMFFGTRETAFMKPSDLSDYMTYKHQHEVPRKHKGFNEGVHEIRVAANLEPATYRDPLFFGGSETRKSPSPMAHSSQKRHGGRILADAFISGYERKRSNGSSTVSRSRASSTARALKDLKSEILFRRRLDSESSNGSKRNKMISGLTGEKMTNDIFDHFAHMGSFDDFPLMGDDALGVGPSEDQRSTRSKRSRGSSKVFEDYIYGIGNGIRHNSISISDNGRGTRSRLISGVSDVFEDMFPDAHVAEQLMQVIDELPSEGPEERPATPEAPAPLPRPAEFCTDCGCECKLVGQKWRCTSRHCQKWIDPLEKPSTSIAAPETFSEPRELKSVKKEEGNDVNIKIKEQKGGISTNMIPRKPKIRIKREPVEPPPPREKSAKERIREEFNRVDKQIAITVPKERKKVQLIDSPDRKIISRETSPTSPRKSDDSQQASSKKASGRPKQYKVEKTPPMGKNGLRNCTFCNGQVRPQMCGGNKHRWRCVDKKCRKWYGWVKSSDEIPKDLGRKFRHGSVLSKARAKRERERSRNSQSSAHNVEPASISSACEADQAAAGLDTVSLMSDDRTSAATSIANELTLRGAAAVIKSDDPRKKGRPMKPQPGVKIKLKSKDIKKEVSSKETAEQRIKRKYTKRKDKEPSQAKDEEKYPPRPISPLAPREMRYRPCAMEKRGRWWLSEKRKMDVSPEREFGTTPADSAAAFRILSHAFRAAAVTRADEPGTVNGSLDLMMDALLGCMAPILQLVCKLPLPDGTVDPDVLQQLWNSSAVYLPMFT